MQLEIKGPKNNSKIIHNILQLAQHNQHSENLQSKSKQPHYNLKSQIVKKKKAIKLVTNDIANSVAGCQAC